MRLAIAIGDFEKILTFANRMELTENDYVIVLGDMGLLWRYDKKDCDPFIKMFERNYKFNLYFIDGNHENFTLLNRLDTVDGMGYVSEHIRWLKRGHCYRIDGKNILAIGGADSVDKFRRTEGTNWWKAEAITDDDVSRVDPKIHYDYVLSHTCPSHIFNENKVYLCTLGNIVDDTNPDFHISDNKLEQIYQFIDFDKWLFGHFHVDLDIDEQFTCLFNTWRELT